MIPLRAGTVSPLAVSYALTDRDTVLIPVLTQISLWAQEHLIEDDG